MVDQQSPRILISRLSAIGDCIHTMPVLCALREHFPKALIAWVVQASAASLLKNHASLDNLIVVERRWLQSPQAVWHLRRRLRALNFDVAIDVQSLTKSAVAAWLSGAKRRIGFARPQGRECSLWLNNLLIQPSRVHIIERYLELLAPLGIHSPQVRFGVPEDVAARTSVAEWLHDSGLEGGFAVLNPGAGWDSKRWPLDRYAQVARYLARRYELPSVVAWAGSREHEWAQQIVSSSGGQTILAPAISLNELAALLRKARLFIGSDTGPLHLAAAVGTPCVGLFGPTRPEVCGPYGSGHVSLQEVSPTRGRMSIRSSSDEALRAIGVERVCRACDEILQRSVPAGSPEQKGAVLRDRLIG